MKKVVIILLTIHAMVSAAALSVKTKQVYMTKEAQPVERVYLGSFLAQGRLGAKNIYRIDAPVGGVVKYLAVNIFQKVHKGEQLLIIKSPKLLELESNYIDMLIEKEYYANEVKRLEPLYKRAVVAKKVFFKAKNTLKKYETQVGFYYKLLQEWGLGQKQVDAITLTKTPIPEIIIESPIEGKVDDLQVYPKMYAKRGAHLMTILNAKGAHFEVAMPLGLVRSLHVGSKLYVGKTPVEVESIASTIDPRTQTVAIRLMPLRSMHILPNEKRNIKLYWPQKALKLPSSAVIDFGKKPSVFVKTSDGYRLVFVSVIRRGSEAVYIEANSELADAQVVISDVIALKGALEGQSDD